MSMSRLKIFWQQKLTILRYFLIMSILVKETSINDEKVVETYFNGDIKEKKFRNNFLVPSSFDSWGKKSIAEQNHMLVNGYANAWYIAPDDVDGKKSYTLIIEMGNQRVFYVF